MPQTNLGQFIGSAAFVANVSWPIGNSPGGPTNPVSLISGGGPVAPTVIFNPSGLIQNTTTSNIKIFVNNLPSGTYRVTYQFATILGSENITVAITDGTHTSGYNGYGATGWYPTTLIGYFNYASEGNRSFEVIGGSSGSGTAAIRGDNADATGWQVNFSIERVN